MMYRTRTYIAGDWTGDKAAIDKLHEWNNNNHLALSFTDAHDLMQARDSSLNCSIKASLKKRLDISKTFVLIVGNQTNTVTSGSCQYCPSYSSYFSKCLRNHSLDFRSYIKYECDQAVNAGIKIVVIYNATKVDKSKCPEILKNKGTHLPLYYYENGTCYWNYQNIKKALS